jgi:hypothetical protein
MAISQPDRHQWEIQRRQAKNPQGAKIAGFQQKLAGPTGMGLGGFMSNPQVNAKNPNSVIAGQNNANLNSVGMQNALNRPNEINPYGSQTFTTDPTTGKVTQTTQLSGANQQLLDQQNSRDLQLGNMANSQMQGLQGLYSTPFNYDGIGNDPTKIDFSADRKRVEDSVWNQFNDRNSPIFAQQESDFRQRMANEGVPEGSAQYNQRFQQLQQQQNDARLNAQQQAIQMGGTELERNYSLSGDARDRAVRERLLGRTQPYTELANILGLQHGVTNPNFQARSDIAVPTTDVGGISNNAASLAEQIRQFNESMKRKGGGGFMSDPYAAYNPPVDNSTPSANPYGQMLSQFGGGVANSLAGQFGDYLGGLL